MSVVGCRDQNLSARACTRREAHSPRITIRQQSTIRSPLTLDISDMALKLSDPPNVTPTQTISDRRMRAQMKEAPRQQRHTLPERAAPAQLHGGHQLAEPVVRPVLPRACAKPQKLPGDLRGRRTKSTPLVTSHDHARPGLAKARRAADPVCEASPPALWRARPPSAAARLLHSPPGRAAATPRAGLL